MRPAKELSRAELATIVDALQQALYLDFDNRNQKVWNPDKSWDGADVCDQLALLLAEHGLVPLSVVIVPLDPPPHSPEHNHDLDDSGSSRRTAHRRSGRPPA